MLTDSLMGSTAAIRLVQRNVLAEYAIKDAFATAALVKSHTDLAAKAVKLHVESAQMIAKLYSFVK